MAAVPHPVDTVAAGYDRLASRWDTFADSVTPPLRERYLARLEGHLADGSRILELGCGTGRPVAAHLAGRHDYIGIDVSAEMVATATRNVPTGRFVSADMTDFEHAVGELDAVIAFYSIIHVPRVEHRALFEKIRSWLRPGGWFVASLTSRDLETSEDPNWLEAGPMFWSGYDAETNRDLIMGAGFDLIEARIILQAELNEETQFLWVQARAKEAES
jgi:SAM-dependent methyltransferase